VHLISLFNKICEEYPNHIALRFGNESKTYRELNDSTTALVALLLKHNIPSGARVGLFFNDPLLYIHAMLALVKLNAIYVPFDKKDSYQNIADLCSVAEITFFLHDQDFTNPLLTEFSPIKVGKQDLIPQELEVPTILIDFPANPVLYIMFTSSTTGKAKGVLVTHAGISRFIHENNPVKIVPGDSMLQSSSIAFDASSFEIWASLLNGATLVLIPKDFEFLNLGSYVKLYHINVLWLTTKLFETLLLVDSRIFEKLKYLIFGGEACTFHHIMKAFKSLPDVTLINGYGPTENTIFTTFHIVSSEDEKRGFIPIGFPVQETQCFVLNEHLNQVEDGHVGTLYVGGAGVAHSYTDKALTDFNFINHSGLGTRLYNTKDLVRYSPEFGFEYLGRSDRQVKLNGFRIELELIENTVNQWENILHAIAVFIPSKYTDELVLFYTTHNKKALETSDLKSYLESHLPWYSIPKTFQFVEEFPLNKSMKVDQKKLIASLHRNVEKEPIVENEIEIVWKEVLQMDSLNPDDNFFDIGGDSLSSLVLISKINGTLHLNLKVSYVVENPVFKNFIGNLFKKNHSQNEIVLMKEGKMNCPIFLIPPLGVGSEVFYSLVKNLKTKQSVFSFNKYLSFENEVNNYYLIDGFLIEKMSNWFTNLIIKSGIYQKVILVGYSLGGNIAIETSFELKKNKINVAQIHLLDSYKFGNTVDSNLKDLKFKRTYLKKVIKYLVAGILKRKKTKFKQLLSFLTENEINSRKINNIPVILYRCTNVFQFYKFKNKFINPHCLDWDSTIEQLTVLEIKSDHDSVLKKGYVEELANKMDESIDSLLNELDYQSKEFDKLSKAEFDHYLAKGWFRLRFGNHMFTDSKAFFDDKYYPIKWIRYKLDASFVGKSIKMERNYRSYKRCKVFTSTFADFNYENDKEELENLYAKYRANITFDGYKSVYHIMHPGDAVTSIFDSKIIKIYDKGKLIGVGLFDLGEISGAGIMYYYDPEYTWYGIGKYVVLLYLEYLVANHYSYFYPGFIFIGHPKLNYKLSLEKSGIEYYDQISDSWHMS